MRGDQSSYLFQNYANLYLIVFLMALPVFAHGNSQKKVIWLRRPRRLVGTEAYYWGLSCNRGTLVALLPSEKAIKNCHLVRVPCAGQNQR
ncbi:hypothetical protein EI94DRAFT_1753775 [Lactarius quietus]|nr:hypothetical protein EI94DRAFT_1753775 [Lactarius quietus]